MTACLFPPMSQLTPIERYAMNFLEDSLEDVCKEELKQAEVRLLFLIAFKRA